MQSRKIPYATITLAVLITGIQILRLTGGAFEEFVFAKLHHGSWDTYYNQPWRMLTSPFIHQNSLHYLENLIFLLLFGFQIERKYGWKYILGSFFGALVTGYVIFLSFMHSGIIGISGGVCGLFGFSLIANRRIPWWKTLTRHPLHILYTLNLLASVVADSIDFVPFSVAHLNHIVGILYGMLFGFAILSSRRFVPWRLIASALPVLLFASQFYSPWQREWRLVQMQEKLLSENPECRLQSTEQEIDVPGSLVFVNAAGKTVAYYWLDYEGKPIFYGLLAPGDSDTLNSFIGHPWCIVDAQNGKALQSAIVTETEQTITIR